ncbi:hypothetical protein KPATCC21470_6096 [Kitasatospora purpeofusca]
MTADAARQPACPAPTRPSETGKHARATRVLHSRTTESGEPK